MPGALAEPNGEVETFGPQVDLVVIGHQPKIDTRILRPKVGEPLDQKPDGKCSHHTNRQNFARPAIGDRIEGALDAREGVADGRCECRSFIGQNEPPCRAAKQSGAQMIFQRFYLMADRRLGHTQLIGSARKAEMPRSRFERPQGIQR